MHYEIRVSGKAGHVFATAPRDVKSQEAAVDIAKRLRAVYPEAEGFRVDISHWKMEGRDVTEQLLEELHGP